MADSDRTFWESAELTDYFYIWYLFYKWVSPYLITAGKRFPSISEVVYASSKTKRSAFRG